MRVKIEVSKEVVNQLMNREHVASGLLESVLIDGINERNEGKQRKKRLRALGFDLSTKSRVKCSQCMAKYVNGTPCHEHGCCNEVRW